MMVLDPTPRKEKASGIEVWFIPSIGLRLSESLVCIGAALAAVHWMRIMIRIPHPNPFLRKLYMTLNIPLRKLLMTPKVFSII